MSSPDLFDAYFRRADTDHDGRVSGQEAVSFFQGANLHREVLAKIWQYADQGQTGYLSRAEFYNALKLVTVAQTGRELTPAIVSRALNGPAASQIPAPQIQYTSGPAPAAPQAQPPGGVRPVRSMGPPTTPYQQYAAPLGPRPTAPTSLPKPTNVATPTRPAGISMDWPTNKSSSWPGPASSNNQNGQMLQVQTPSTPQDGSQGSFFAGANSTAPKAEPDFFGGDVFTAIPSKSSVSSSQAPATQILQPTPTVNQVPQQRGTQAAVQPDRASFSLVPSSFTPAATSNMLQPVATPAGQQDRVTGTPAFGIDASKTWPKMTDAIVRRYTKIFFEVDTDKDGKISGTQARDLFLSWHLPREVLKQIWDLSDQDHDSMLSLREFCVALYLMERHREGRTLPAAIPAAFYYDESGVQALRISEAQVAVAQNSAGYNLPAWRQNPGVLQAMGPGLPPRPVSQGVGLPGQSPVRVPVPVHGRDGFVSPQMAQPNSKAPTMEMRSVNHLAPKDQLLTHQGQHQEAVGSERKVYELEKQIMDSKEKMEFYRTKMQDIVLFKTRCDNRLAEITERAAADKREVESCAKRYDEKYKQAGESQARLLADEAAFRDVQDRRLELHNALLRMEQGGDLNAFLQVRADRLQNDLDELKKVLDTKCKQFGLRVKPISLLEIPFGWQPGIQDTAAQWDENWDNFEDEGFAYVQDFMEEGTAGSDASKPKSVTNWDESGHDPSTTDAEVHAEEIVSDGNRDASSVKDHQDSTGNGEQEDVSSSNTGQSGSEIHSTSNIRDPHKLEHRPSSSQSEFDDFASNGGEWPSVFTHKNDDTDSNASWGKSDAPSTKASEDSIFQSGRLNSANSFGLGKPFNTLSISGHEENDLPSFEPIRTKERPSVFFDNSVPSTPLHSSPGPISSGGFFDNSVPSTPLHSGPISSGGFFDDSVPSTPLYNNYATGSGSNRDQFVRFDSFSSTSSDFRHDSFARFDSFSQAGSGPSRGVVSFDEPNPLGTGPFGGGQSSRHTTNAWSAFG